MDHSLVLPSLPVAVTKFLEVSLNESCDLKELANLAGTDPALSAQILRVANSPYFSKGRSVSSLQQASVVLGLKLLQNIALTIGIYDTFSDLSNLPNFSLGAFWYHSLSTATSARRLAERVGFGEPEEAFIAGLLHDIGQLALIKNYPERYQQLFELASSGKSVTGKEKEIWGKNHAQIGAELLKKWRIQPVICDAIWTHHQLPSEIAQSSLLAKIIYLADILSRSMQRSDSVDIKYLEELGKDLLGLAQNDIEELSEKIETDVNELSLILGFTTEKDGGDLFLEIVSGEQDHRLNLKDKARNYSLLVGTLQSLVGAVNERELIETFIKSLILFLDVNCILYLNKRGKHLYGEIALGTKDDAFATKLALPMGQGTIWDKVFETGRPIYSKDFFARSSAKIIERKVLSYLGQSFGIFPIKGGNEFVGAILIGEEDGQKLKEYSEIIGILSNQVGQALKSFSLRKLLRKEQAINEAILKHTKTGFILCKEEGDILFLNPICKTFLNFSNGNKVITRENLWDLLGIDEETKTEIIRASKQGKEHDFIWHNEKDNCEKWIRLLTNPIEINGAKRLLVAVHDISAEKLLEKERLQHEARLKEELGRKTEELRDTHEKLLKLERLSATADFARKVVHEVNNPLGVIKNYLRILKIQYEKGELASEAIDAIDREIDRISSILNQLRDFANGAGGLNNSSKRPGSVENAIMDIERLIRPDLDEKGIKLEVTIESNLPLVKLDEDGIKQLLINMIKNAEEALDGREGIIRVKARKGPYHRVIIEISDTGPGIDVEIKDRIFDPYVSTKGAMNSGLGLSVCYGLVKSVGGEIHVKDTPRGATFEIGLPIS
ncbi:HDIG domain protein [Dissulfuribacter thermophilus]|uniref:histidine kinase n=1 Tax=Dissulfuribacter thermophilus TaxID=1156395 RepID=A0A1B9F308_9BACT|nr:HDOD domain-containing protein [Dissulfuribacter thermophilus]OCC14317.1 HDIG domain protein [Dissulfuribacter thermophilus]